MRGSIARPNYSGVGGGERVPGVISDLVLVRNEVSIGAGLSIRLAAGEAVEVWGGNVSARRLLASVLTGRRRGTYGAMWCAVCDPEDDRVAAPRPAAPRCWRGRAVRHLVVLTEDRCADLWAATARETAAGRSVIAITAEPTLSGLASSVPLRAMRVSAPAGWGT